MGRNNNDQDIHDRHPNPSTEGSEGADSGQEASTASDKPKFSWPGKDAKEQQRIRDAHYKENGVKADLTGGTVPESES